MLEQVTRFEFCINQHNPWEHLLGEFFDLMNIVDELAVWEGLVPQVVEEKLLRLLNNYVQEWRQIVPTNNLITLNERR